MSQNNSGNHGGGGGGGGGSSGGGGTGGGGGAGGGARASWGTKVGYIGTGVLIGLIIYPFVRKALSKVQPKIDKIFDDLTGKAEHFAEKASDIMARAKENLAKTDQHEHSPKKPHVHGDTGPLQ